MKNLTIEDPVLVGVSGTRELYARKADIDAGELNGDAQVLDTASGEASPVKPLQVWFKWGIWHAPDSRRA